MEHSYNNETGFKGSLALSPKTNTPENGVETLRRDWFNHVLLNIEKLYYGVEDLREKILVIKAEVNKLECNIDNKTDTTTDWKEKNKILRKITITTNIRAGMFGALAGFVSGGIVVLIICIMKGFLFK